MLSEQVKQLLNAPRLTETAQGIDSYPRVIRQEPHGDNYMMVTFALPGLRRQKMLVPIDKWVAGDHLSTHDATMRRLARLTPPRDIGKIAYEVDYPNVAA